MDLQYTCMPEESRWTPSGCNILEPDLSTFIWSQKITLWIPRDDRALLAAFTSLWYVIRQCKGQWHQWEFDGFSLLGIDLPGIAQEAKIPWCTRMVICYDTMCNLLNSSVGPNKHAQPLGQVVQLLERRTSHRKSWPGHSLALLSYLRIRKYVFVTQLLLLRCEFLVSWLLGPKLLMITCGYQWDDWLSRPNNVHHNNKLSAT